MSSSVPGVNGSICRASVTCVGGCVHVTWTALVASVT